MSKNTDKLRNELVEKLAKASGMSKADAKKALLKELQQELSAEVAKKVRAATERAEQQATEKARELLVDAMRHGATKYVAEYTVSTVPIPSEAVKGRIIGKGGKNIRAFEKETGVEMEMEEGNEIKLSSFDSVRREVARRALETLVKDARIQPSRIEEVVKQTRAQVDDVLLEEGKKITEECGVFDLSTEILKLIGKFRFRTSYGQNLGVHTIEETKIGAYIADEIGADTKTVRLGCLLHDIGKVIEHKEGSHVEVGVEYLKKHGFPKAVINAVAEHHEDIPFSSMESVIVWIADAISGSRPGARYEPHEEYVSRMTKIEDLVKGFPGVVEAYAFQAGRDVRVVVNPKEVDDDRLTILARDIANKLENEANYAGRIKVTAIREVRAEEKTAAK